MQFLIDNIRNTMATEGRSLLERALKTSEEAGELAGAVLSLTKSPGSEYKNKTVEDVVEESADVFICSLAMAIHADPNFRWDDFLIVIGSKLGKWKSKIEEGKTNIVKDRSITVKLSKHKPKQVGKEGCGSYDMPTGLCLAHIGCHPSGDCCYDCSQSLVCTSHKKCKQQRSES